MMNEEFNTQSYGASVFDNDASPLPVSEEMAETLSQVKLTL